MITVVTLMLASIRLSCATPAAAEAISTPKTIVFIILQYTP